MTKLHNEKVTNEIQLNYLPNGKLGVITSGTTVYIGSIVCKDTDGYFMVIGKLNTSEGNLYWGQESAKDILLRVLEPGELIEVT